MVIAANLRDYPGMRALVVCLLLTMLAMLAMLAPKAASAQNELQAPEPRVKAAFLFKFGSYVEWPAGTFASASAPFTIGVMDADALADELTAIVAGRSMDGRPVVVRKFHSGDPTAGFNVVFIGKAGDRKLADALSSMKGRATLAVTESENALELGSMINFVIVDGKVRFDVALPPVEAGNLKISSRLLAVARKVVGPS
jgi:hypothetical protein